MTICFLPQVSPAWFRVESGRQPNIQINDKGVRLMKLFKKLVKGEKGVTSLEYALIASLIAISIIAGITLIGTNIQGKYDYVAQSMGG